MDITNDKLFTKLREIRNITPLPSFVKEAAVVDIDTVPDDKFAAPHRRMYPVCDPANTYLSAAYFTKFGNDLSNDENKMIGSNIINAALFYGIEKDVQHFIKAASQPKPETTDHFALPSKRAYPIANVDQVYKAVDHFQKHSHELPVDERRQVAQFICKRANEFGYPVAEHIVEMSRNNATHLQKAAYHIANRCHVINEPKVQRAYMALAKELPTGREHPDLQMLHKIASVLEQLDHAVGIDVHYGKGIVSPINAIFNMTTNDANMMKHAMQCLKVAGKSFPSSDVMALPKQFWSDALGDDFAQHTGSLEDLMTVIETLPLGDKKVLRKYLESVIKND